MAIEIALHPIREVGIFCNLLLQANLYVNIRAQETQLVLWDELLNVLQISRRVRITRETWPMAINGSGRNYIALATSRSFKPEKTFFAANILRIE